MASIYPKRCVPRIRDDPLAAITILRTYRVPRTRGMILERQNQERIDRSVPRTRGMIPTANGRLAMLRRVPRTRGDDPVKVYTASTEGECSSHTRG